MAAPWLTAHHVLGERASKVEAELYEHFERHVDEHDVARPEDAHVYVEQRGELAAARFRPVGIYLGGDPEERLDGLACVGVDQPPLVLRLCARSTVR